MSCFSLTYGHSHPLQFFEEAQSTEAYLKGLQDCIRKKYPCDKNMPLQRLLDQIKELEVSLQTQGPASAVMHCRILERSSVCPNPEQAFSSSPSGFPHNKFLYLLRYC